MKSSHAVIIIVVVAAAVAGSLATILPLKYVWFLADTYDYAPATTSNPFNLTANLSLQSSAPPCKSSQCQPEGSLVLTYAAKKPLELVSYNICGGLYCIRQDNMISYGEAGTKDNPVWGEKVNVGEGPWKAGDLVDIRLKVVPVGMAKNGIVPESENMLFIDLGKSKVSSN